jgi:hypothetical protein
MKTGSRSLFRVRFQRIEESNQFSMRNWNSEACDVLQAAILLDFLPRNIMIQYSKTMKNWMIRDARDNPIFCTGLNDLNFEVWSPVTIPPFFPGIPLVDADAMVFIDESSILFRFDLSNVDITDPFIKVSGNDR